MAERANGVRARLASGPLALGPARGEEWCWAEIMLCGSGQKKEMDWAARESRPQAENRERERFSFFFYFKHFKTFQKQLESF